MSLKPPNILILIFITFIFEGCESAAKREARINLNNKSLTEILSTENYKKIAALRGEEIFHKETCWNCHGKELKGGFQYCPDLTDDLWIWGGAPDEIFKTIKFGVRQLEKAPPHNVPALETRWLIMPRFDSILSSDAIDSVTSFTHKLMEGRIEQGLGMQVFKEHCVSCHGGLDGKLPLNGVIALGKQVARRKYSFEYLKKLISSDLYSQTSGPGTITAARRGMPAWKFKYSDEDIKSLVVYILAK